MSNVRQGGKLSSAFVAHDAVDVDFTEPSRTRQEFAEECDINNIMKRFEATGAVNHFNQVGPRYLDLSEGVPELREALDLVRASNEAFMSLPARVRAEFDNDPVAFVDYAADPSNAKQMVEWGLAIALPEPAKPAPVVSGDAPAAPAAPPPKAGG
ncbi:MAG: internal scaffolding protein [Microviridae sp.]|nr:MAG: internal scaffolding protein [Microviridae sp.]